MNMISTGAFQNEMDASNKQNTIVARLVSAWEKKNAKVARAGGVSLMALSLAACGSDDDTASTDTTTTTTTTTSTTTEATTEALTNGTDTISASGVINAGMVWSPGGTARVESLQSEDSVTGTGTADTINITTDGGTIAPKLTGVETVSFALAGDTAATLNLANSTGYTSVVSTSTDGDVSVTGLSAGVTLSANSMADAATNAAFQFTSTAVLGTTSATVNVDGFLGTNLNIGASAAAAVNGTGVETLTLNASGAASSIANLGSSGVTTLNIDADANLTLSALSSTAVTSIDLTGSTATTSIDVDDNIGTNDFTYVGGAGADTLISNNAFTGTDSLSGGDGADTLSIRVASGGGDTGAVGALNAASAAVVSGFETLDLRSVDDATGGAANDYTVDMDHVPGVTAVTMRAGDATTNTQFTLNDLDTTQAQNLSVVHTGTDVDTDSEVLVDMKTNGADTVKISYTTTADGQIVKLTDNNNDIENAEITLAGAYTTNLDAGTTSFLTSLTVNGGSAGETLTISNAFTGTTVDMSGVASNITTTAGAGNQTYKTGSGTDTFTNAAGNKTVELGAGNDTFSTTVAQITKLDSTDAGAGTDTLKLTSIDTIAATAFASISGFERLSMNMNALAGDKTIDMANLSDSFARVSIGATNDNVVTVDNVDASMNDLRFTADFAGTAVTTAEAVFDRLTDTTADAVSLNVAGGNTVKTLSLLDEETITVTVSGSGTGTITTLNVADVTAMTLSGGNTLTVTTLSGGVKLASIDASAATVAATINSSASMVDMTVSGNANSSGALVFTTGAGTDTITGSNVGDTLTAGIGNDTISGFAGADTLVGGLGNDTVTGGSGEDIIRVGGGSDTITDFTVAGLDNISIDVSDLQLNTNDGTAIDWVQVDRTAASVGDTDVLKGSLITGAIDLNTLTGNENMLVLNGTVATSALTTVIGTGGTFAVTAQTVLADDDGFLVLHTDGSNAYLQLVSNNKGATIADGATMAVAQIGVDLVATLTGVTDLSGWTAANEVASVA
jgi:Ca2+-binding RTX toxin-like protein